MCESVSDTEKPGNLVFPHFLQSLGAETQKKTRKGRCEGEKVENKVCRSKQSSNDS